MPEWGDPKRATRKAAVRAGQLLGEGSEHLGGGTGCDGNGFTAVAALTQGDVEGHLR